MAKDIQENELKVGDLVDLMARVLRIDGDQVTLKILGYPLVEPKNELPVVECWADMVSCAIWQLTPPEELAAINEILKKREGR